MLHQTNILMCLKNSLEVLAIKYRKYNSKRNNKLNQEMRIKSLKEEAFREVEKSFSMTRRPPEDITPKRQEKEILIKAIPEKEKRSIEDENMSIQKLMSSNMQIIKQTQNKVIELSMLIRQFSVKAFEQEELSNLSKIISIHFYSIDRCRKFSEKYTSCQ
jgi:hypothetical protein